MSVPKTDTSGWPVVIFTFGDAGTLADIHPFLHLLKPIYARASLIPFVSIVDCQAVDFSKVPAAARKVLFEGINALTDRHVGAKFGEATLMSSQLARVAANAVNMMRRRPYKTVSFKERKEALAWAQDVACGPLGLP